LEATIEITIQDARGIGHAIEAIVDTGFNGSLTLPVALVESLGLQWYTRSGITLADGSQCEADVYATTVIWDGMQRDILVESVDAEPLLGMQIMRRHALRIEVVERGDVVIEALP
jgi:clan AA aspartic protease